MNNGENCNIIVCGPSAVGKSAILKRLGEISSYSRRKSYSSRAPRGPDDSEYNFLSRQDFERKIQEDFFWEYNEIFGNYYGISCDSIDGSEGKINIFNMDVQGAENLKKKLKNTITILIIPPSLDELSRRLKNRDGKISNKRIARQAEELSFIADFIIENREINQAAQELLNIIDLQEKKLKLRRKIAMLLRKINQKTKC
jgi:guanylate kinase